MLEKIKEKYGQSAHVVSVQEYFAGEWFKLDSDASIEDQISSCVAEGATILSFHATIETLDEESKKTKTVDIYPDVRV